MITLIDYNMGNLRSVSKALEHLGSQVQITSDPDQVISAKKLVLPGVGAFGDACKELRNMKLFAAIQNYILSGRPFLGICLGLQLLFENSEESPGVQGLGVFQGTVKAFKSTGVKIPHMGWNQVVLKTQNPILTGLKDQSFFYFVHSFYACPQDPNVSLGETLYGQENFPAIVGKGKVFATQFHPEKSQDAGLQILKNFIAL